MSVPAAPERESWRDFAAKAKQPDPRSSLFTG